MDKKYWNEFYRKQDKELLYGIGDDCEGNIFISDHKRFIDSQVFLKQYLTL